MERTLPEALLMQGVTAGGFAEHQLLLVNAEHVFVADRAFCALFDWFALAVTTL